LLLRNDSNYGFDPLGLAKDPASLARFKESEVFHCRWAMLGAAGCLGVEALGFGNWYDAPMWVSHKGGKAAQLLHVQQLSGRKRHAGKLLWRQTQNSNWQAGQ
jgi:hypothetical protein